METVLGARRPALHFDDDAQAFEYHAHHLPQASPGLVDQLGPHPSPVKGAVALPNKDEITLSSSGCGATPAGSPRYGAGPLPHFPRASSRTPLQRLVGCIGALQ